MRAALGLTVLLTLAAGCRGQGSGSEEQKDTGSASSGSSSASSASGSASSGSQAAVPDADMQSTSELEAAVEEYKGYVVEQTDELVEETTLFTDAVLAGNVEEAKELYAPARVHWERIEPIAATLGDLDAREGDEPEGEWRGFHRIERALWIDDTTEGREEYARQLQEDVETLQAEVSELQLEPADLVTGSIELLNEVSAGEITGEEERYSRTDLYDIQANVEGSEAAFDALRPAVEERDPDLVAEIEERFDALYETLAPYREGEGWYPTPT